MQVHIKYKYAVLTRHSMHPRYIEVGTALLTLTSIQLPSAKGLALHTRPVSRALAGTGLGKDDNIKIKAILIQREHPITGLFIKIKALLMQRDDT